MSTPERSLSRGRDVYQSSGRGGMGNIRQASVSRETRPDGPDDFSKSRGREPVPAAVTRSFSTGRGGAGNIRSPSRDISKLGPDPSEEDEMVIRAHAEAAQEAPQSTGRGGIGNIAQRSRSRGPPPVTYITPVPPAIIAVHSTGRGGAGNISLGDGHAAEIIDERERRMHGVNSDGLRSTGRGGSANLTPLPAPGVEHHTHQRGEYESTGRGGAGNMIRDRSASRPRA